MPVLGRMGSLETRFARSTSEIRAAQTLRYNVFYDELGAKPGAETRSLKRDQDRYDHHCGHLLVLDNSLPVPQQIVGTCRMMEQHSARAAGGFYTESEFDLSPLFDKHPEARFLEIGRSCISRSHRSKRTIELMWQGIWAVILEREIEFLFGCASFHGTNPKIHSDGLAWLKNNAVLADELHCPPRSTAQFSLESICSSKISESRAFASLPPLFKGYLRLGAKVASQAVIDHQFDTIDLLVVLNTAQISKKYLSHYRADASRFAA